MTSASSQKTAMLLAVVVGLTTVVLFWPATGNLFVNLDDLDYVTTNYHVQSGLTWSTVQWAFTHTVSCNWHPLALLSHALDCQLYGLQPWGHHLTSVLLHATNAALLFLLLYLLTGSLWGSFFVGMLFAWHPLRVESVVWISERKDVLCGFFWLLTLLAYGRYAELSTRLRPASARQEVQGPKPKVFYGLALVAFMFALMSKPMAVTLPFVLLLLDFWPLKRIPDFGVRVPDFTRSLIEKIPFFVLAAAISGIAFTVQHNGQAMQTLEKLPFSLRIANALVAYLDYIAKLFYPANLAIYYPYAHSLPWTAAAAAAIILAGISLLVWLGRVRFPYLLVGWFWFLGVLVPVIGLVQVGSQAMADRYTYLPCIGLLVALVWGLGKLASQKVELRYALVGALTLALAGCWMLTRQQIHYWHDGVTLFEHSLAVTPDNAVTRNTLGSALALAGRGEEALTEFQAAVRLNPEYPELHNNYGNLLALQNHPDEALTEFQAALKLRPDYADAHFNYGNALLSSHRTEEAIAEFQTAARLEPDDREAHYKLGNIYAAQNRLDDAIAEFQEAVRIAPDFFEARNNLGSQLSLAGRLDDAILQFEAAIRSRPDYTEAHYNLGLAFMKASRLDGAISEFQVVNKLTPDFVPAHYSLGLVLEKAGQPDAAAAEFQTVIKLKPDHAPAHDKLGIILATSGKLDAAIAEFQEAVRLKPDYAEAQTNLARALEARNAPH